MQYTLRTENDEFKLGDRIDYGVATNFHLMEDPDQFPRVNLIGELNLRHIFKEEYRNNRKTNSGGTTLFVSPGIRVGFSERFSWTTSPQLPALQELNDEQQETLFRLVSAVMVNF